MKSLVWFGLLSAAALAAACGGQSLSEGDDGAAGDSGENQSGGTGNVGADGGTANIGQAGSAVSGSGGSATAGAAGSPALPLCTSDLDCPADDGCTVCVADGSVVCPVGRCLNGACQVQTPVCPNPDPCANLACGDPCYPSFAGGSPGEPGALPYMTCNVNGVCQSGLPECFGRCTVTADCPPLPPSCLECPNGTCQTVACIDFECRRACAARSLCMTNTDCVPCDTCYAPAGNADIACYPSSCQENRCYTPCD